MLFLLGWAVWLDYSEHGYILPGRVVDRLKSPMSLLPELRPLAQAEPPVAPPMPAMPTPQGPQASVGPTPTPTPTATPRPTRAPTPTPTPRPTKAPTPLPAEKELLIGKLTHDLINKARASSGLAELEYDERLAEIARNHSKDMVASDFYSHRNRQGEGPSERASRQGYVCHNPRFPGFSLGIAENILAGYGYDGYGMEAEALAQAAVKSWMGSNGHRANILKDSYAKEGIGVAITKGAVYFTQKFC